MTSHENTGSLVGLNIKSRRHNEASHEENPGSPGRGEGNVLLRNQFSIIKIDLESEKLRREQAEAALAALEARLKQAEIARDAALQQSKAAEHLVAIAASKVTHAENTISSVRIDLEAEQKKRLEFEEMLADAVRQRIAAETAREVALKQVALSGELVKGSIEKIVRIEQSGASAHIELEAQHRKYDVAKDSLISMVSAVASAEQDVSNLRLDFETEQKKRSELESARNAMIARLAALEQALIDAQSDLEAERRKREALERTLEAAVRQAQDAEQQKDDSAAAVKGLKAKLASLEETYDAAMDRLSGVEAERELINRKLLDLEGALLAAQLERDAAVKQAKSAAEMVKTSLKKTTEAEDARDRALKQVSDAESRAETAEKARNEALHHTQTLTDYIKAQRKEPAAAPGSAPKAEPPKPAAREPAARETGARETGAEATAAPSRPAPAKMDTQRVWGADGLKPRSTVWQMFRR